MQLSTSLTLYHYYYYYDYKKHAHKLFTISCSLKMFISLDFRGIEKEN